MAPPLRVAAVIPARMASSRLPGKPLLEILGLPMIEHVRRRALLCRHFSEVVVATCDQVIADVIAGYGGRVVLTAPNHPAATDRVAEAMQHLECTHIVNVQGDEILILPQDLEVFVQSIEARPDIPAWNALAPIEQVTELQDPAVVKCVISTSGRLLFCARDFSTLPSPAVTAGQVVRKVLGILGYRRDFLARYGSLARTPLERAAAIDQMRIIEHDVTLQGVALRHGYPGINELREVPVVKQYLTTDPMQQAVLEQISEAWPANSST